MTPDQRAELTLEEYAVRVALMRQQHQQQQGGRQLG
jgi:hypothetical protein